MRTATAAAATEAAPARVPHLDAVDLVRVAMIVGVIAVHTVAYTTDPTDLVAGGAAAFLHINREVFFFLSAFVLTYSYGSRHGWSLTKFWKKRYLLVGAPYLVWSVVYFYADGGPYGSWANQARRLVADILAGTARYHLYFLLVTMQIYAVFPVLLWLLRATRRHHAALLGAALAVQVAFTGTYHYAPATAVRLPGLLGSWMRHPDAILASYALYVVAGGVAAMHLDEAAAWVRSHRRAVHLGVAAGLTACLGGYLVDHFAFGMDAAAAGEVFQPMVVVTTAAAITGLFTLGLRWADRGGGRPFAQAVRTTSDATFGVYLGHPLLLQALLALAGPVTAAAVAGRIPVVGVLLVDLVVVVPLLGVVSVFVVRWIRRTPASLFVAGRPQRRQTRELGGAA